MTRGGATTPTSAPTSAPTPTPTPIPILTMKPIATTTTTKPTTTPVMTTPSAAPKMKPPLVCHMMSPLYLTDNYEKGKVVNSLVPYPQMCDYILFDIPQEADGKYDRTAYEHLGQYATLSKYMFSVNVYDTVVSSLTTTLDKTTLTDTARDILQTVPLRGFGILGEVSHLNASAYSPDILTNHAGILNFVYARFTEVMTGLGIAKSEVANFFAFRPLHLASRSRSYRAILEGLNTISTGYLRFVMLLTITSTTTPFVQPSSAWDKLCLASGFEPTIGSLTYEYAHNGVTKGIDMTAIPATSSPCSPPTMIRDSGAITDPTPAPVPHAIGSGANDVAPAIRSPTNASPELSTLPAERASGSTQEPCPVPSPLPPTLATVDTTRHLQAIESDAAAVTFGPALRCPSSHSTDLPLGPSGLHAAKSNIFDYPHRCHHRASSDDAFLAVTSANPVQGR
ncbi:uncharacterized protein LOC125941006 [Dermacentor silvarum]|uniref:uncharacterized protein LOC125941006 n=1 Tax=Dermacentor silvarum TaxID=543639 RepID=UPI002100FE15|nr:uncharacterized protein LOC125941006 [Dermacentor silvarum]